MKKIVVFTGSPRKNGYSARLVEQVIVGAKSKGADIMVCDLNADGVKGCQGCSYCKSHTECITKDTMSPALEALRTADGVVASFPIYWMDISGQSKLFLDRLYSFINSNGPKHPGKKFATIFSQGSGKEGAYKHVMDAHNGYFKMFGWEMVDSIMGWGSNFGVELTQQQLDRAFEAGCKLAE